MVSKAPICQRSTPMSVFLVHLSELKFYVLYLYGKIEGNANDNSFVVGLHSETAAAQSQALNSSGNAYIPKVRKPYIITKQRQKWTDEEHQKFLEAVKLYGRTWRQIEEYVGTKTAIQIRSHAQKYIAKVERDTKSDSADRSLNVFEIPPPRPKKKPLHPYPRKVVNPIKNGKINAVSPPPNVTGEERSSPASVFCAIGSPLMSSRRSPTSCTTDDVLLMENDNECLTSNYTSIGEKKRSLESAQVMTTSSSTNNKLVMEAQMLTLGGPYSLDNPPATDESSTTIKLFGRTLVVNDSQKVSSDAAMEEDPKVLNFPKPDKDQKYAFGFIQGTFSALSCFVPPQCGMDKDCSDAGFVSGGIPWRGWCEGMVFPQVSSMAAAESPSWDKRDQETEPRKEGSNNNSNSSSKVNALKTKTNDIISKAGSKTLKKGSSGRKGFLLSKKCLAERDLTSPLVSMEEHEGQRTQVCS